MAILTYRITQNSQSVNIPNVIHAQSFIFRRAVVRMVPLTAGNVSTNCKGGVVVSPSHFSGFEISSGTTISNTTGKPITNNLGANDILIGLDEYKPINNIYFDMEFESEDVNQGFTVKITNFDKEPVTFGTQPGELTSIDVYFQFASLYDYKTY
jgi:hypothetical protein